ncbi:MAG: hypothetical protein Q7T66_15700 [Herminiimonas sp.]|uniref:hypothetical protein n=1 Tax=Herminiimonas sp. TaxID=1926289 RepID=UPI00271C52AC|nr:hypothetical protein [Herminiimonas sp.]MDO9422106.1 hypothetical protein [Herminiimonas sp.]
MSANYWRNRWVAALVHNGFNRATAEDAYKATYGKQSADYSKSPEIQALMTLDVVANKFGSVSVATASTH